MNCVGLGTQAGSFLCSQPKIIYYCDNHDRKDLLINYRKRYLDSEFELELRQPMPNGASRV